MRSFRGPALCLRISIPCSRERKRDRTRRGETRRFIASGDAKTEVRGLRLLRSPGGGGGELVVTNLILGVCKDFSFSVLGSRLVAVNSVESLACAWL